VPTKLSCTMHSNRYYSYRRDYTHKRMASVVTTKRRGPDV
jgi:copper oxidase (laccase) domain-containing protein